MDPIKAIQTKVASMSDTELEQFTKETGFSRENLYLMNYETAKQYCKSHNIDLASTNPWAKYNKAKADWNKDHTLYLQAKSQYQNLKYEIAKAEEKYYNLATKMMTNKQTDALSSSDDLSIRRISKYTTDNIKMVRNAELSADSLLAKCQMDVDNQRAGLNFGTIMDFKS